MTFASLACLCLLAAAQGTYPEVGGRIRYRALMQTPRAYLSGICILLHDTAEVRGSWFNEFGITALEFSYDTAGDKVRLHRVAKPLDKWYVRRVVRRDLRQLLRVLQEGGDTYVNEKRHITYTLTPMREEETKEEL